jgi:small subunit ribosomal protein S13
MVEEFRTIIRVVGTNVEGTEKAAYALTGILGVGIRLAQVIVKKAGIDPETRIGFLSDAKVRTIEDILENPTKYAIPGWFLNREKDKETGDDLHIYGPNLLLQVKSDIDEMGRLRSWRGFRHSQGLKVRGQRTRTTGRRKRLVGVKRRRVT